MAACEEAFQRRPHFARVYFLRGMSFSRNGNLDQAIEDYTRAVEINPKYREAFNNRGLARGKKGDVDGAIEDFTQTILIYPDAAPAYVNRAGARIRKGDREGGMKDYEEALRINPKGGRERGAPPRVGRPPGDNSFSAAWTGEGNSRRPPARARQRFRRRGSRPPLPSRAGGAGCGPPVLPEVVPPDG